MTDGITFTADKIKVNGPRIDGSYTVTFELGEYDVKKVAALLTLPQDQTKTVEVTINE